MKPILLPVALVSGLLAARPAGAEPPPAQEIADRASAVSYYQGEDGRSTVEMVITDSRGRERSREMTILRRDSAEDNGNQRFFVFFRAPADVRETAFLVWKNASAEDDRWIYLPALDLVRRIAASDVRTSFVGSHFFYEDVSGRSPSADNHTLIGEDEVYYILRSEPKDPGSVEFTHYISDIHKTTMLPVRTEYYRNGSEDPYRTYDALEVSTIDGFPTVVRQKMTDHESGGFTVLTYRNVRYNVGLEESVFAEQYLRNPPAEALQ